jgi:predicted  nucleic acid-binding Zn-ribbon protein
MQVAALCFALVISNAFAVDETKGQSGVAANPIRRVVTLLQDMQKKVEADGKKEKALFEKFMCYCKNGADDLKAAVDAADAKIPKLESSLAEAEAMKEQLVKDVAAARAAVAEAKQAIAQATSLREKEAAAFAKDSADYKANIAALKKAIAALEAGMAGKFLQTRSSTVAVLQQLAINRDMRSVDRDMLSAFLAQGTGYAPASGEITGILKQMLETMEKELAEIIAGEEKAAKDFEVLVAAKEKEVDANTGAIESKMGRAAELGLEIVELKEDLEDTTKAMGEDKKFMQEIAKSCGTKEEEWNERCKVRADELLAIGETIKILNDDDALDLFKKTLPSAALLQTMSSTTDMRKRAIEVLRSVRHGPDPRLDFIVLSLRSKAAGHFDKIMTMIDDMVILLGEEQVEDDMKKAFCEKALDKTEDEVKELERKVSDLVKAQDDAKDALATLTDEIKALAEGIEKLDKQVADANEQRHEENTEYKESMAANGAAKKLLELAKDRLAQFYTPKLAKGGASLADVMMHSASMGAPQPPPETWGAYKKKTEESGGVVMMLTIMIRDVDKDLVESKVEEKEAQKDYETLIGDSAMKRRQDSKTLSDKESAKADLEGALQQMAKEEKSTKFEVVAKAETLKDLHMECDWLLGNYEVRKEARTGEIDALKNAKSVLAGAE